MDRSLGPTARGNFYGSAIVGAIDFFIQKYGPAAAHAVISRLPSAMRAHVKPNAPTMGLLGAKLYPYSFIGELVRAMVAVVKPPNGEDEFIREVVSAGMDATLATINRILLRWVVSPQTHAAHAQEVWNAYHDSGRVRVLSATDNEYIVELSEWPNHDVTVCKICLEARRRVLEKTGLRNVEATRVKCLGWGHDVCVSRYRY